MSSSPREIGTLIVVVMRAKNLPNKRHIGKQDPYCSMRFNMETRRTRAVKRGGQHPEWDEEVRFSIYEDAEDELARTANGDKTPPPKERYANIKGGKSMRVCCYADDPREPELIGETQVDLTEALTKGEVDEWFTLQNKDKYAGEVYLEMTFWSKAKPPAKKKAARPSVANPHYGGPGSFTPSSSTNEIPAALRPNREASPPQGQLGDPRISVPESLRPSTSALGAPDLYIPPYNPQNSLGSHTIGSAVEPGYPSYDELGMMSPAFDHRRRDSYPPMRQDQAPSIYGHPSNASIASYQQPQYDSYSAASLAQSMSNMHLSQTPAPSLYAPATPAPAFNLPPSQFGYGAPPSNIPPPFPQGPGYPGLGYGAPPSATPMPPNGAFQPGYPPHQNGDNPGGIRLVSSGFAGPPPIPTPMPYNVPPPAAVQFQHASNPSQTPFPQQPPNPSHTPYPQQQPYPPQQYPPPAPAPLIQNGLPSGQYPQQMGPFSPQATSPGHGAFQSPPPQALPPPPQGAPPPQAYPQSTSPPTGMLPPVTQPQVLGVNQPQHQPYYPQQPYVPQQNPPPAPPMQHHNSTPNSRPLPTPQQIQGPASSSSSVGPQPPGAYPPHNMNGQQWQGSQRSNSLPQQPHLPGPPPPLPSHNQPRPPQASSPIQSQSPPRNTFQAPPPPPPATSFQSYQNNAENELPPPPSAYKQPSPHPQQQQQSVPVGGIFPGPSTTTIYPGPPPKPPQMVAQHHGWQ